jgi:hypothetical protein
LQNFFFEAFRGHLATKLSLESSFFEGRKISVAKDGSMISMKTESKAEKMEKIRSKADLTFELFQKEMCKFLVVPSLDDPALMYVDFSDVMRRRLEFESSYQAAMSGLNILLG